MKKWSTCLKMYWGAFRGRKEMYGKGQDDPFTKGNGGYRHVYGNTWRMEEEKWKILKTVRL